MRRYAIVAAGLLVSVVLGATVFRAPIAMAAQLVNATIVGPLDADGNVKVHDQGTVSTRAAATDAADWAALNAVQGVSRSFPDGPMLLSFAVVDLDTGITELSFRLGDGPGSVVLVLNGPTAIPSGQEHYVLALPQPALVDRWVAHCGTTVADACDVFVSALGTTAP